MSDVQKLRVHKKEFICKDQPTRELGLLCQFPSACLSLKEEDVKGARRSPRAQQQKLPPQLRRQLPHTAAETCLLPAARKLSHATSAEQRVQHSQTNEVYARYKTLPTCLGWKNKVRSTQLWNKIADNIKHTRRHKLSTHTIRRNLIWYVI